MDRDIDNSGIAAGHAALAICEALLLALIEEKLLSQRDTLGLLQDATVIQREDDIPDVMATANRRLAAQLIDRIIASVSVLPRS